MKENFISGVHNYCDRWCERCRFVSRCAVGSDERLENLELQIALSDSPEEEQKHFVQHLTDSFSEMRKMLEEMIKEKGLNLEEILAEPYEKPKPTESQKALEQKTRKYIKVVDAFFEKHKDYFVPEKVTEKLMTAPGDLDEYGQRLTTALEVIRYFQFFISVKTHRAWSGKQEDTDLWYLDDPIQADYNGSAKIALLAIQESMDSWEILRDAFTELDDDMLDVLAFLDGIKKGVEGEFPDAYRFVRPGFDEGL